MSNLEQKLHRPTESIASAPMDSDDGGEKKPDVLVGAHLERPSSERTGLQEAVSREEQQIRNSELMKALD